MASRRKQAREVKTTIRLKNGRLLTLTETDEMPDYGDLLRTAIQDAGLTQYVLAKTTGIPQGALSKFMAGGDLRLMTFNKLAHALGFDLIQNPERAPHQEP